MQSNKILATSFSSEKSKLTTRNAWKITIHPKTSYKKLPSQRDTIWVASVSDSYTDIHGCVRTYIEHYTANERFIYASIPYDWYIKRMIWVSFINDLFEIAVNRNLQYNQMYIIPIYDGSSNKWENQIQVHLFLQLFVSNFL